MIVVVVFSCICSYLLTVIDEQSRPFGVALLIGGVDETGPVL